MNSASPARAPAGKAACFSCPWSFWLLRARSGCLPFTMAFRKICCKSAVITWLSLVKVAPSGGVIHGSNPCACRVSNCQRPPRTTKLLRELKRWADQERGRRMEVAKLLKVHPQAVSNLLAGRQHLTGEQALTLREFLDGMKGSPKRET